MLSQVSLVYVKCMENFHIYNGHMYDMKILTKLLLNHNYFNLNLISF